MDKEEWLVGMSLGFWYFIGGYVLPGIQTLEPYYLYPLLLIFGVFLVLHTYLLVTCLRR